MPKYHLQGTATGSPQNQAKWGSPIISPQSLQRGEGVEKDRDRDRENLDNELRAQDDSAATVLAQPA